MNDSRGRKGRGVLVFIFIVYEIDHEWNEVKRKEMKSNELVTLKSFT